ncbi:MAG: TolC family protein [Bacteroidaceae bacterium]|nr:TolC family protein [Bacteroidaceae bacterium]
MSQMINVNFSYFKKVPIVVLIGLFGYAGTATAVSQTAAADTISEAPMSLHDCMAYAVRHSTKMRTSAADRSDERAQRRQAIMQAFTPSVSASTYAYNNYGRNIDPETNTYNTVTSFHNGYSVSASLTLFDGFQALDNLRIATTTMKMGISRDEQTRDAICLATMEAYYNVLYYTSLAQVLTRQVETAEAMLRKAVREEELGQKSHADVVQMEAELAKKQFDLTSATNQHVNAMLTLKDVMYWPTGKELEIRKEKSVSGEGLGAFGAIDNYQLSIINRRQAESHQACLNRRQDESHQACLNRRQDESHQACLNGRGAKEEDEVNGQGAKEEDKVNYQLLSSLPAAAIARGTLENARAALHTARWAYAPSLGLYGGWSTNYFTYPGMAGYVPTPFREQFRNNSGEYIQLSMSIPIFDRFSRRTTLRLRRNAVERAEAQYEQTMRDIENEVSRAVNDRDGAASAYRQAVRRAEVEEEAYTLSRRQYEQGLISPLDYQTASQAYLNAQAERLGAQFRYRLKQSVVRYYNGTPYLEQ